jgi:peptide/nickel transport system ATP-binding protein
MIPKIQVRNLKMYHEHKLLLDIPEFSALPGEVHAIVGESGSGKSLLLKQIMGFVPQNLSSNMILEFNFNSETITIDEQNSALVAARRGKKIGMIFQEPLSALNPQMTCGAQLMEAWNIYAPKPLKNQNTKVLERLDDVGLGDISNRVMKSFPHELSGGQRQRVMIAMATLHEPEIILADEPTTALDFFSREKVLLDLLKVVKKCQSTLIWVTHELEVIEPLADKLTVLRKGEVIQSGTVKEVLHTNPHPYVQELWEPLLPKLKSPNPKAAPILNIQNIVKSYSQKIHALQDITIDVHASETLAIIGTSGSGKSTLAKLLVALESPTSGSILFEGQRLSPHPPTGIQMVFQDPLASLNRKQTAFETLNEIREVCFPKESKEQRHQEIIKSLHEVVLDESLWHKRPDRMSGGQRQRLCIAKALSTNPKALILDEAVAALDPLVKKEILRLLTRIQEQRKLIYLFITHDLPTAAHMADAIIYLEKGRIKSLPESWNHLMKREHHPSSWKSLFEGY